MQISELKLTGDTVCNNVLNQQLRDAMRPYSRETIQFILEDPDGNVLWSKTRDLIKKIEDEEAALRVGKCLEGLSQRVYVPNLVSEVIDFLDSVPTKNIPFTAKMLENLSKVIDVNQNTPREIDAYFSNVLTNYKAVLVDIKNEEVVERRVSNYVACARNLEKPIGYLTELLDAYCRLMLPKSWGCFDLKFKNGVHLAEALLVYVHTVGGPEIGKVPSEELERIAKLATQGTPVCLEVL